MNKKIDVEDFVIICSQQGFEADKAINPIEIKIENDRIQICSKNTKGTHFGL